MSEYSKRYWKIYFTALFAYLIPALYAGYVFGRMPGAYPLLNFPFCFVWAFTCWRWERREMVKLRAEHESRNKV